MVWMLLFMDGLFTCKVSILAAIEPMGRRHRSASPHLFIIFIIMYFYVCFGLIFGRDTNIVYFHLKIDIFLIKTMYTFGKKYVWFVFRIFIRWRAFLFA